MGLLDKLSEMQQNFQAKQAQLHQQAGEKAFAPYLFANEQILLTKVVKEDFIALTDKRLLFMDKGLLSSKKYVTSVPYTKITAVSLEVGGAFKLSKNVVVWVGSKTLEIDLWDSNIALEIYNKLNSLI